MKLLIIKLFVLFIKIIYAPMKLRSTEEKILWLSRQSNEKSLDIKMLSAEIEHLSPEAKQVFRLRKLKNEDGLSLSYIFSIFGDMWEMANSSVVITDTYSIPVSCLNHKKNLEIVQIWHSLGAVKKFGLQAMGKAEGRNENVARAMKMHRNYTCVVAPSKKTARFYCEAFGTAEDKILVASLPRVDVICDGQNRRGEFLKLNPQYENKRLVAYFPTFRTGDEIFARDLSKCFEKSEETALLVKPHPLSKCSEDYKINGKFSTYDIMKLCDGIITDYSASAIEFSLLKKPLWFYVPDIEYYKLAQGLNIDPLADFPHISSVDAEKIRHIIENEEYDLSIVENMANDYVERQGTGNTKYLAVFICSLL